MSLLILNGYEPLAEPTAYTVNESDTYAIENEMEDGTSFVERSRSNVYKLSVGYTNITKEQLDGILSAISELVIRTQFYFGTMKDADMRVKDKDIKLSALINGQSWWNLSFNMEEF